MSNFITLENINNTGFVCAAFSLRNPKEKLYYREGEDYEKIVENNRRFRESAPAAIRADFTPSEAMGKS